jgi:hypothetical protein
MAGKELFFPRVNAVGFKRNNSSKVTGKPPEIPEIAAMAGGKDIKKRDALAIKKPK